MTEKFLQNPRNPLILACGKPGGFATIAVGTPVTGCPLLSETTSDSIGVQAAEDGHRHDPPDPLDRSMDRGVFVQ